MGDEPKKVHEIRLGFLIHSKIRCHLQKVIKDFKAEVLDQI